MRKLGIVATHPIPYQCALFRHWRDDGIPVHVMFLSNNGLAETYDFEFGRHIAWDTPLMDSFDHEFLPQWTIGKQDQSRLLGYVNPNVVGLIRRDRFCAIMVHGYRTASMIAAMATAKARGVPVIYRSESWVDADNGRKHSRLAAQGLRHLVDICLPLGSRNDAFYRSMGVPDDRRFFVPYAVNNHHFQSSADIPTQALREQFGLPADATVILYVGKLVPWKQPDHLLDAFAKLTDMRTHLVIVGTGSMESALRERARQVGPERVSFFGFRNQSEMPAIYRAADLLVLPSRHEPWGLVVNEAMAAGLPVLVSDRVGCSDDLVIVGKTGAVFRSADEDDLLGALERLVADRAHLAAMGGAASNHIGTWGFEQCTLGLRAALERLGVV